MERAEFTGRARRQLETVLQHSTRTFGRDAAERYFELVEQAARDLGADPLRPASSRLSDEKASDLRVYALRHSRLRVPVSRRVRNPCHVLVYDPERRPVQIVGIFHDRMDLLEQVRLLFRRS